MEKGLSLNKLSKISGIPKRTIEDEIRRDNYKANTTMKFAKALDVS